MHLYCCWDAQTLHALLPLACLLPLLPAVHDAAAGRQLHKERDWGESGDPSGLSGIVGARAFTPHKPQPAARFAVTPEGAESSANAAYTGPFRPIAAAERRTFATAEAYPSINAERHKTTIRPRARSAQDVPELGNRAPNLGSGEEVMPALVIGGYSLAETFEGASAIAASDAVALNRGGRGRAASRTTIASSMRIGRPRAFRNTDVAAKTSFGVSASEPAGSVATSGVANGKIVLAQANQAVAVSQSQARNDLGTSSDDWQQPWRDVSERKAGRRLLVVWAAAFMRRAWQ
jgi:hypothetical protein